MTRKPEQPAMEGDAGPLALLARVQRRLAENADDEEERQHRLDMAERIARAAGDE